MCSILCFQVMIKDLIKDLPPLMPADSVASATWRNLILKTFKSLPKLGLEYHFS